MPSLPSPSERAALIAAFRGNSKSIVYLPRVPKERSTHDESRKNLRGELNALIKVHLVRATGRRYAKMTWTMTESGIQKIMYKYGVKLEDWPKQIPFRSPGKIWSVWQLHRLIRGFTRGEIKFRRVTAAEVGRTALKFRPLENYEAWTARVDRGEPRNVRQEDTRSQRLRSRDQPVKTTKWVPESEEYW